MADGSTLMAHGSWIIGVIDVIVPMPSAISHQP
jgi:hypothetical protein